jgi:hypothetical protein
MVSGKIRDELRKEMRELSEGLAGLLHIGPDDGHIGRVLRMTPVAGPVVLRSSTSRNAYDVGWVWRDQAGQLWGICIPDKDHVDLEITLMEHIRLDTIDTGGILWLTTSRYQDEVSYLERFEPVIRASAQPCVGPPPGSLSYFAV